MKSRSPQARQPARGLAALLPRTAQGKAAPFVELPLGATEDRVVGSLDISKVLQNGSTELRSGLLARAGDPAQDQGDRRGGRTDGGGHVLQPRSARYRA